MALSDPLSFVDLRQFAVEQEALQNPSDNFETGRRFLDLDQSQAPVSIGLLQLSRSTGRVHSTNADEFIVLTRGTLSITAGSERLDLATGQSALLPKGSGFSWDTESPTSIIFMRHESEVAGGAPVAIDATAELEPSAPPVAELLVGPTPSCRNHNDFKSASGEFICGTWDSTPYQRRAMFYRHFELMHLLEGSVTFEDAAGRRATFHKDDIFLVKQGARCGWLSEVHVKKVFAIYRPC